MTERYSVVQWGTGCTGSAALKAVINHPKLELVGVKVYSDAKVGLDAGNLCGMPSTGVVATKQIGDILALRPNCVVYMPDTEDVVDMCVLLAAGINIVTPCLGFNHRDSLDPVLRSRIESACEQGHSSLYASGSSPGWLSEILPFAITVTQSRLESITITDYSDMAQSTFSASMLFDKIHFGADPASIDPDEPIGTAVSTPPTLRMMADALGIRIDAITALREFGLTKKPVELAAGRIEAGTIGAVRMVVAGLRNGVPVVTRDTIWHVTHDIDRDWDLCKDGIRYVVKGDVPLDIMIQMPTDDDTRAAVQGAITANPVVNAIPYVCAAVPGILQTSELPTILANFA